ncbi:ribosomal protein L32 [Podospora didyma]|uniref:Ribosomal protein L32 n=1 Tax=Podospora didyma TaxID=330526 RepID=A0AAE0KKT6_9PEZI|nr:ribosomal protein L32 [Podospora didyma]
MTTTKTMAIAAPSPTPASTDNTIATTTATTALPCCPQCGSDLSPALFEETQTTLLAAQKQIADLEAQVRLLNHKASAAVDRWADYEDELAKLRAQLSSSQGTPQPPATPPTSSAGGPPSTPSSVSWFSQQQQRQQQTTQSPVRSSFLTAGAAARITALLSSRSSKSTPSPPPPNVKPLPHIPNNAKQLQQEVSPGLASASSNGGNSHSSLGSSWYHYSSSSTGSAGGAVPVSPGLPSTDDLLSALTREQALRLEAEGHLSETSREVEELSVSLFEQANEMVAAERRARFELEKRVETLEKREADKKRRLDRLEGAMDRIERVRVLLGQTGGGGAGPLREENKAGTPISPMGSPPPADEDQRRREKEKTTSSVSSSPTTSAAANSSPSRDKGQKWW